MALGEPITTEMYTVAIRNIKHDSFHRSEIQKHIPDFYQGGKILEV